MVIAFILAIFVLSILHIGWLIPEKKVIWIYASGVITRMEDVNAFRNINPVRKLICNTMGAGGRYPEGAAGKAPVPSSIFKNHPLPFPASFFLVIFFIKMMADQNTV